jgi:hypothetical protein
MKPKNKAHYLGRYQGQRIHHWPVHYAIGEIASLTQQHIIPKGIIDVIARTAREAADYVADLLGEYACVELTVLGPKGGKAAHRWWGWDRSIWNQMLNRKPDLQLRLPFPKGGAK